MNMKKKWEKIKSQIFKVIITINSHHTGAYAAQAAYFFVLSLIPIFLLLLTMVRFTPITMSEVMTAVLKVFPESVAPMIRSIVSQVYFQSGTIVPVTIVVALWSAGKGVLSVTSGLNSICENMETRNYFYLRIRASFYTVIFLLAIVSSLVLSVFGNRISVMIYEHIPFLSKVVEFIIRIRTFVTFVVLTVFWDLCTVFFRTGEIWQRQLFANSFRERCLRHADGCFCRSFFRYTLMCLKALQVCTEV